MKLKKFFATRVLALKDAKVVGAGRASFSRGYGRLKHHFKIP